MKIDQKTLENAMGRFHELLYGYPSINAYLQADTTVDTIPSGDGFNVVINGNDVFHMGAWEHDQIRTYVYCTICILREISLKRMTVTAD